MNRLSLFGGSLKEEDKKEDPYMRPMILVQQKESSK